ncbi:sugar transferase [Phenylobacterium sp.]|uniref:sugar transferase n=1 Tax=Phenylobacterium sp. TaxID=1871053 RepID=UPI0035AED0A1
MLLAPSPAASEFDSYSTAELADVGRSGLSPGVIYGGLSPGALAAADVAASRAKRLLDVVVSATALLLLAPALLLIALAIYVETRGPIFFLQQRTGYLGQVFPIVKFRTMTVQEDGRAVQQACRGDPRITRVGAVLRKLSLDELPQLINVLRGEMSLVGPRPHAVAHDEAFMRLVPNYAQRFRARPGITGLAQVHGLRGEIVRESSIILRAAADIRYVERWSLLTDVVILARTALLIFRDRSAF